jgi:TPR repeat protein
MAAAAATTPPTASPKSSPIHRKPLPLQDHSPSRRDWGDSSKTLPSAPPVESPRLRQSPISPVRVNFQPENWAQPSNANIEFGPSFSELQQPGRNLLDRALPKTPEAPTPPPHTPENGAIVQTNPLEFAPVLQPAPVMDEKPLPMLSAKAVDPPQEGYLSPTGLDFGPGKSAPDSAATSERDDTSDVLRANDENRRSRETGTTVSTSQEQASTESSVITSASSVSGLNESSECPDTSNGVSPESSIEDGIPGNESVPQLQYHHQAFLPQRVSSVPLEQDPRAASNPDLAAAGAAINRHLTPNSNYRRSSIPRPASAYSVYSDTGPRGRSPGFYGGSHMRAPSAHSRKSPETRPSSYADMLNVPYPQPAPAPLSFDNAKLRTAVGTNASLLSAQKTLEMYRANVKKTNDLSIQYSFAVFLISTAQEQGLDWSSANRKQSPKAGREAETPYVEGATASAQDLVREARSILQRLSNAGYPFAQYYLADGYASGLFSKGKEDYNSAFPLFVLAAKHGHAESAYRTALCYEFGWGCRRDPAKAVQFLRTAASKRHPGAMTRLGKACLSGDLGEKRYKEGIKWLKLATESADSIYNAAPYHLGCLYETGYGDDIFQDESYAAELFTQAADLGHPEANFRMGDAYEHGRLNCPRDPALSVHFYTGAAERGHAAAMMGLCAWYMVGAEPILEKDEEEAYEWARRSAELGKFYLPGRNPGRAADMDGTRLREGPVCRRILHRDGHRMQERHTGGQRLVRQGG